MRKTPQLRKFGQFWVNPFTTENPFRGQNYLELV